MHDPALGRFRVRHLVETASTNTDCVEAARAGAEGGLWIVAEHQTRGRGSRGRCWISTGGNLHASLLLEEPAPLASIAELTFVLALAVHDTICECLAERGLSAAVSLKWPNDVLLDGRKVSGLLLECHSIDERRYVVAGIGINCTTYPPDTLWPATSLNSHGVAITPDMLLRKLSGHVEMRLEQWQCGAAFASIRTDWIKRASGIGERIEVRLPAQHFEGVFEGLDASGRLILLGSDGVRERISAADIFPAETGW